MTYELYNGTPPHEAMDTSKAAAEEIRPHISKLAERVYHWISIRDANGATNDEIEAVLNLPHQTASARVRELVLKGRVRDSGMRRRTRSKRLAAVWVVTNTPFAHVPSGEAAVLRSSEPRIPRREICKRALPQIEAVYRALGVEPGDEAAEVLKWLRCRADAPKTQRR